MSIQQNVKKGLKYKNPIESQVQSAPSSDIFDFDLQKSIIEQEYRSHSQKEAQANPEFKTIFTFHEHYETKERHQKIKEMQQLIEQIRIEVKDIKSRSDSLTSEVENIEKITLQSLPERPGVYHIRYLELILSFLQGLKVKVGEAKTWLMAMQSKKAKRGSAFVVRSKKKGTQYSMSQELQAARNVM
ncbi:hypothetical protein A3C24_03510 [Candidatus Roizmanbacteria bacterium RIFCSPHIGHO2_02_FULL_37_24]|uniref:DUF5660 domain-containing protein n=1 Tax=Candidatus Roizmanbacteria bacterium RIFCSPHIGHO2_02_FULL_37_24 TaxID=1802037 RepID=A0A1F7GWP1_9BACT|nr:MAG: hypothetical protein A3C24_03510 [Candidatus Roizmanbacteria bacterium RIFCSPHIGHO2_02_FULL_37_24]OGK33644.1 MAG: hypothetical protein A3E10_05275 [Candidatus Roizmanbacteria bacterium RIFCSPHIGHO2_12_FULL_37_23]OGK44992.1 MAG: hypothetical protein A2956_00425 [Candidatus Roizmanbacteria bacterium RIFCSPLOWO2_01_FULL_37_57]OGK58949.1 MAG: hypothetical protein A3G65_04385 [Candidatus Roizmanbacteria bacterium RIFCSPLOWO2_12_FULL_37_7b]